MSDADPHQSVPLSGVHNIIAAALAVATIVVGVIALTRKNATKAVAGIGLGIGISVLTGVLSSWLYVAIIAIASR